MLLREINPFIRYVRHSSYVPINDMLCAVDYHFYYTFSKCSVEIGGQDYSVASGGIIIIPPGMKYRYKNTDIIEIVSINFDFTQNNTHLTEGIIPTLAEEFSNSQIVERIIFSDYEFLSKPIVVDGKGFNSVLNLVENIVLEFDYKKQFYLETASALFKQILLQIARKTISGDNPDRNINTVLRYIHRHFSEDIDNLLLAEMAGYHSYHLNRLMKKFTGTTLRQYIINCRIDAAKSYLRETDFQICKIAEMCGYKNFTNFSRDFKAKCGITPGKYRKEVQHML